ncbi:hypothetical protein ACTFIW_000865 [Dictyostelium discoideum]
MFMLVKFGKQEKPRKIVVDEKTISQTFAIFIAEPFERVLGHSIGNAQGECYSHLWKLQGNSVSFIDVPHEFMAVEGIAKDVTNIVLNIVIEPTLPKFQDISPQLTIGPSISVIGIIVMAPSQGTQQKIEVKADHISILGEASRKFYKKSATHLNFCEQLLIFDQEQTHFELRVGNALSYATHTFFQERGFLYVQTPIITSPDCEGAGEMLQVTTLDINKPPREKARLVDWS